MNQTAPLPAAKPRFSIAAIFFTAAAFFSFSIYLTYVFSEGSWDFPSAVKSFACSALLIFCAVAFFLRKRNILPFLSAAALACYVWFDNLIFFEWSDVKAINGFCCFLYLASFVLFVVFTAIPTFAKARTPGFFKKAWFIPGAVSATWFLIRLITDLTAIKEALYYLKYDSLFRRTCLIANWTFCYLFDAMLVAAFLFAVKWVVNTFAALNPAAPAQPSGQPYAAPGQTYAAPAQPGGQPYAAPGQTYAAPAQPGGQPYAAPAAASRAADFVDVDFIKYAPGDAGVSMTPGKDYGFRRFDGFAGSVPQRFVDRTYPRCPMCRSQAPNWTVAQHNQMSWKGNLYLFKCSACNSVISMSMPDVTSLGNGGVGMAANATVGLTNMLVKRGSGKEAGAIYAVVESVGTSGVNPAIVGKEFKYQQLQEMADRG